MANVTVAVLGLGRVGTSVGLALKRYNERKDAQHQLDMMCADLRAGIREDAQKAGLTDRIGHDLFDTVRGRDIVVMALPYADVQTAYKEIGPHLRPGAVLLDASPLKLPSLEWSKKHLNKEAHMVGITPILNPKYLFDGLDDTLHASADLFDKGNMLLMPAPSCVKEAVELASDFSSLIGATPHFFDAAEHDSLMASTDNLAALVGVASFYMLSKSAGWNDAQRLTNPGFGRLTRALYDTHPDDMRDIWFYNRDNMVRQVDQLISSLQQFRSRLAAGDRDALEAALIEASDGYSEWINHRHNASWNDEKKEQQGMSFGGTVMSGLMGGFISKRLQGNKNNDDK